MLHPAPTAEDLLSLLYDLEVEVKPAVGVRLAEILGISPPGVSYLLQRMERDGLVELDRRKGVRLSAAGRQAAESVVRRRRLAERFLVDRLGMDWVDAHAEAHRFEHAMSPRIEARMLEVLGWPATCPHGNPIPGIGPPPAAAIPLSRVRDGSAVRILRIVDCGERKPDLLHLLERYGLGPGAHLTVARSSNGFGTIVLRRESGEATIGLPAAADILVEVIDP